MEKLLELLENATNVKSIFYDKGDDRWEVCFFTGKAMTVTSDILLDFLENG